MKRLFQGSMALLLLLLVNQAHAQSMVVNGVVTSNEDGKPLSGVTVAVKGTPVVTTTNYDGKFSVNASIGQTLAFSYVGFQQKEIVVNNVNTLTVRLDANSDNLKSVVVIGYG